MRAFNLLFILLFLSACATTPPDISKNGILLTLNQGEPFSEKTKVTIDILRQRLKLIGAEHAEVFFDEQFIQVEIPGETDFNKYADLLTPTGAFGIYELYQVKEVKPYIEKISREIEAGGFVNDDVPLKDELNGSTFLSLMAMQTSMASNGRGILAINTADKMSKILKMIGSTDLQSQVPKDLEFKVFGNQMYEGLQTLYAIKKPTDNKSLISNKQITGMEVGMSKYTGEEILTISFDQSGTKKWAQLTTKNVNRTLLVYLDNLKHMAPVVNAPITGGIMTLNSEKKGDAQISKVLIKSEPLHKALNIESFKVIKNGEVIQKSGTMSPEEIRNFEVLRKKLKSNIDAIYSSVDRAGLPENQKNLMKAQLHQVLNQHIFNSIGQQRLSQKQLDDLMDALKKIAAKVDNYNETQKLIDLGGGIFER